MYAVINQLHFSKPVDELFDLVKNDGMVVLSEYDGFQDFHFVKINEYTALVYILWKDGATAQAAFEAFRPTWFSEHFSPILMDENRMTGEVIVSYK